MVVFAVAANCERRRCCIRWKTIPQFVFVLLTILPIILLHLVKRCNNNNSTSISTSTRNQYYSCGLLLDTTRKITMSLSLLSSLVVIVSAFNSINPKLFNVQNVHSPLLLSSSSSSSILLQKKQQSLLVNPTTQTTSSSFSLQYYQTNIRNVVSKTNHHHQLRSTSFTLQLSSSSDATIATSIEEENDFDISDPSSITTSTIESDVAAAADVATTIPKQSTLLSANQQELVGKKPYPRTWVPLGSIYELDPNRPNEVQFLGLSYVLYRGTTNPESWVVADNTCPHRLAPLSEGRIIVQDQQQQQDPTNDKNDNPTTASLLQCSYHGWTFDNNGTCVSIPQADPTIERMAFKNHACHVPTYPTLIYNDIIWSWIWPESISEIASTAMNTILATSTTTTSTPPATAAAAAAELVEQILGHPQWVLQRVPAENITTFTRELPYGWDTLLENIVDPSHVPFAHHGLQGTRDDATPITMTINKVQKLISNAIGAPNPTINDNLGPTITISTNDNPNKQQQQQRRLFQTGFDCIFMDRTMTMKRNCTGTFRAPYLIQYEGQFYANETDRTFNLSVIMTPVKPGWSRITIFGPSPSPRKTEDNQDDNDIDVELLTNTTSPTTTGTSTDVVVVSSTDSTTTTTTKNKIEKSAKKPKGSLFFIIARLLPVWIVHQFSNRFLDSDLAFLHYQEQERQRRKRISFDYKGGLVTTSSSSTTTTTTTPPPVLYDNRNYYFVPAQADRGITTIRRWIRDYASYVTDIEQLPERIYNRDELFNRYIQHTDKCKHCSKAYHITIPLWRKNSYRTLCASVFLLALVSKHIVPRIVLSMTAIVSIFIIRLLSVAERLLTKGYDFKHYENQ